MLELRNVVRESGEGSARLSAKNLAEESNRLVSH